MEKVRKASTYSRILSHVGPYWPQMGSGLICTIFVAACNLSIIWMFKDIIDRVLTKGGPGASSTLNLVATGIILLFIMKGLLAYGQVYLLSFVGQKVVVDLRNRIYAHLQRLSMGFHDGEHTGEMVSRVMNDVSMVQNSITNGIPELLLQIVTLSGILILIFYLHWKLSLVALVIIPCIGFVVGRSGQRLRAISAMIQAKVADITVVLQETLSGIRIVKAFTMEPREIERFARENERSFRVNMEGAKVSARLTPLVEFLAVVGMTVVLWYGGHEVINGKLTLGEFMAFLGYLGTASTPMGSLSRVYGGFQLALGAADRIFNLLDVRSDTVDKPDAIELAGVRGHVVFKDISFAYGNGEKVLDGVNLKVRPGEIVALVGPSGAGKTTLINLIPRFYDPSEGTVEIDGHDIRRVKIDSLRRHIGLVPQETILFGVTVKENIAYGKWGATDEEIVKAARMANAHDFIIELQMGYNTKVGERGLTLSGGQRQRIAIARAILRDPKILILDEATSSLDSESESLVQEALERLLKNRTTFVVAHRLSTIRKADKIVVLEKGRIVETGTHQELLARGGLYARLYATQLAEEAV